MLTPYQFASNTPIQAIDLDGLEARYATKRLSDGTTLITITIRIRVKNSTNATEAEVKKWMAEGEIDIETIFKGHDPKTKTTYKTNVQMIRDPNLDDTDIWRHTFHIEYVNEIKDADVSIAQGRIDEVGNTEINRARIVPFEYDGYVPPDVGETTAHEIGHGLGLRHHKPDDEKNDLIIDPNKNIMGYQSGIDVTLEQLKRVIETIDATKAKYEKIKETLFKNGSNQ
jgi:hypothetical protein